MKTGRLLTALTFILLSCAQPQRAQHAETTLERPEAPKQTQSGVVVTVAETRSGESATYRYTVVNRGGKPVVGLRIGYDHPLGEALLTLEPVGWTLEGGLAAQSVTAPPGWTIRLVATEESNYFTLEWSSDRGPEGDIMPGTSEFRFAVTVPRPAPEYSGAKFDAIFSDSTHMHGQVVPVASP